MVALSQYLPSVFQTLEPITLGEGIKQCKSTACSVYHWLALSGELETNRSTGGGGPVVAVGVVLAVLVVITSIITIVAVTLYRFVEHCSMSV